MNDIKQILDRIQQLEGERKYPAALELAQKSMRKFGRSRPLAFALARLLQICKEYKQALGLYRGLHEEAQKAGNSSELAVVLGIGHCMFKTEHYEQAENLFAQLQQSAPNHPDVLANLAALRRQQGRLAEARQFAEQALQQKNDHKEALFELAEIQLANKETDQALQSLERNIRRPDVHGDSIDLWMSTLAAAERNRYAQDSLEELAKQYPHIVEFVYGFAVLANKAGEITLARPAYQKAMELSPDNPRILYELGVMERVAGDLELSQKLIGQALTIRPDNPAALRTFGSDLKYAYGDDNYKRLNYAAAKFSEFSDLEQIHLHYAMAKAGEDVGELDAAFRHYSVAGAKKRKMESYDEQAASKLIQIIPQVVTPSNLAKANERGCESETPVFILGMPRSGTSLMEQILSSHPDVFGAGELKFLNGILENIGINENKGLRLRMGDRDPVFPYDDNASWELRGQRFVDKLTKLADKPYARIVDKMPGNFNFVGLIHAILPNAKIIHSRRHPVETCLSCYRIHFAEGHQWTYNLRELGRFYKRYWGLMKHWREAFPGVMYEVRYEDNVADVEGQAKKLIDHLGLPWDENCLNFYNTDRPVKTASVTQVRKPIYNTSTNRWRKYEKYLGPLLEELGDIVPQYEAEIAHLIEK
jgi:tetratricopeptide (TPR) repeat protein